MPKYNLNALGHEEFERLCQSLVQIIIGSGVKVYGMGRDGSREATFKGKAPYPSKEEQWDGGWIFRDFLICSGNAKTSCIVRLFIIL